MKEKMQRCVYCLLIFLHKEEHAYLKRKRKIMRKIKNNVNVQAKREDVARLAGVSGTTVSFVFSQKRYVSPELRDRVLDAAKQLNYQPDMIAATMGGSRTNSIAILTNDIVSPLQMEIIKALQESAIDAGYFVYICGGTKKLENYISHIISRKVDGVFLSVPLEVVGNECIKMLLDRGISVLVTSSRGFCDERLCGLELDFCFGMEQILKYLKECGHEKIAYLSCYDNLDDDKRLPAFRKFMNQMFHQQAPLIELGEPPYESTIETGEYLMKKLLSRTDDFTAVICANDLMAFGALHALHEHGLDVPRQVSVVGIDDISLSKSFYPALTTLSHRSAEYGKTIFEILRNNIENKNCVERRSIEPKLIVRNSTGQAPEKR